MPLSHYPLGYCTNVHPGRSIAEIDDGLDQYTVPIRKNFGAPMAAGLWFSQSAVNELLADAVTLSRFAEGLQQRDLVCYTLNAFPFGDFHSDRVKKKVYVPDWSDARRLEYTKNCAQVLATLLPERFEGSVSTLPLAFKLFCHENLVSDCVGQLIDVAKQLGRLYAETGKRIRLAIEPEPYCVLERIEAVVAFFETQLRPRATDAGLLDIVNQHLGICFDVCHQAVEFEDVASSIDTLQHAGIRINKIHATCALQLDDSADNAAGREALARYAEPRYLHQTFARTDSGTILSVPDLTTEIALRPGPQWLDANTWRIHFHVPVNVDSIGPLRTTRAELELALAAVRQLDYAPHWEIETYTWGVLPEEAQADLVDGLTCEMISVRNLLAETDPAKYHPCHAVGQARKSDLLGL